MKRVILASIFSVAATAAFAQAAPPAAGAAPAPAAPAPAAPPAAGGGGGGGGGAAAPQMPMSFFVAQGPGTGNLGGLAGADQICNNLARAAGSTKTFRAYLSTVGTAAVPAQGNTPAVPAVASVNARDRIGNGPWFNSNGVRVALNVAELHGDTERDRNYINQITALDEKKAQIPGVLACMAQPGQPATPGCNKHDILTGSDSFGRAYPVGMTDTTCGNWTSDGAAPNRAMLGHSDRLGGNTSSWNAAHFSQGCGMQNLVQTGGSGKFYCFAID
jgi:hypothetical protein